MCSISPTNIVTYCDETLADRVARGAAWMDEQTPDWFRQVNDDTFDVADCETCIWGQVYGGFFWKQGDLGWDLRQAEDYGFTIVYKTPEGTEVDSKSGMTHLTSLWGGEISKRRLAAV